MKLKKVLACLVAATFVASVPSGVLAGEHTVNSVQGIIDAIIEDGDDIVTITLEPGEYDFGDEGQEALVLQGKTYEINGEDITLTDVNIAGNGTLTITATIENKDNYDALSVGTEEDELNVTVNGDVNSENLIPVEDEEGNPQLDDEGNPISTAGGVFTWGEGATSVTINGDVTSAGSGVGANQNNRVTVNGNVTVENEVGADVQENATVEITGDITGEGGYVQGARVSGSASLTVGGNVVTTGGGIYAEGNAVASVEGNITSGDTSVDAYGSSQVTVDGNIIAGDIEDEDSWTCGIYTDSQYDENGDVIEGTEPSGTVTVNGSITATGDAITGQGTAKITVNGDVTSSKADGVYALSESNTEVNGNVSGGYIGVDAEEGKAIVTVNGVVGGTHAGVYAADETTVTVNGDVAGYDTMEEDATAGHGVIANGNAVVTVNGNVTGGDGISYGGHGVAINEACGASAAKVTVTGDVKAGDASGDGSKAYDGVTIAQSWISGISVSIGGTVTGGTSTGEGGESGWGIYYWVPGVYYTSEDLRLDLCSFAFYGTDQYYIQAMLEYINITDPDMSEKAQEIYDEYCYAQQNELTGVWDEEGTTCSGGVYSDIFNEINAELMDFINESMEATGEYPYEELSEKMESVAHEKFGDLYDEASQAFIENYDNAVKALKELCPYYTDTEHIADLLPSITTWKVQSGEGIATTYGADDESVAEWLETNSNYSVKTSATNGTITLDKDTYEAGETIVITPTANDGYDLSKVLVNGVALEAVDGVYSYVMPQNGGVEISAEFTAVETPASDEPEPVKPGTTEQDGANTKDSSTPTPSTTNKSNGNSQVSSPKTADGNMTGLWVALGGAAGVAALAAASKKKRNA